MRNVILFGGSFDPIHNGHVNMALEAQKALGGSENCDVYFIPNKVSVWKTKSISVEHKMNMLKLAIGHLPNFYIDEFEINNDKDNYSYLTVRNFISTHKDINLYWLIGQDQVELFHLWKNADEIAKNTQIIYYGRYDGKPVESPNIKIYNMKEIRGDRVLEISSTQIRGLHNLDIPYKSLKYICDNNLYFLEKVKTYIDDKRFKHMKSVGLLAYAIALSNNIEVPGQYFAAGLLHDVGKNVPDDVAKQIEIDYKDYMPLDKKLYHQFYSALIAEKDFGIKDKDILDAIRYHATGKANMTLMGKAVYAADKIDPLRGYDSADMVSAMLDDIDSGFEFVLSENRKYLLSRGKDVDNKLTLECFNQYLREK